MTEHDLRSAMLTTIRLVGMSASRDEKVMLAFAVWVMAATIMQQHNCIGLPERDLLSMIMDDGYRAQMVDQVERFGPLEAAKIVMGMGPNQ